MDLELLKRFNETDWDAVTLSGVAYIEMKARKLRWKTSQGLPKGNQPVDIYYQAVEKTLEGIKSEGVRGRLWNRAVNPDILDHLRDVMDSEISNLVLSSEHKTSEYFKDLDHTGFDARMEREMALAASNATNDDDDILKDRLAHLRGALQNDEDAIQVLEAFELLASEEGLAGPQELADVLGFEVATVNNALKRIRRAAGKIGAKND